jgi:signal transduction histidine kinase
MRRLIPDSLFGRTIAVLILGLAVTHFASIAIHYSSRGHALSLVGGGQFAERIATMVGLFDEAPPAERRRLARVMARPGFAVSWGPAPAVPREGGGSMGDGILEAMLALSLDGIGKDRLRAVFESPEDNGAAADWFPPNMGRRGSGMNDMMRHHQRMMGADPRFAGSRLRVSVGLSDGSWLNLTTLVPPQPPFWSWRGVASFVVTILLVVLLAGWVVRRMTAPLNTVAAAADRLGRDVNAPPLPESGAIEVRRAARAFNRMQERIRGLIDARTRMLAAISHDLRTPITRLRLRAEFIEDEDQRDRTMADLTEMEEMVASVLSFARDDARDEARETVDLAALLQSVCDDLADSGRDCQFSEAPGTPYECRPLSLRRAITNLANNAVAYGMRARVSLVEEPGRIVIRIDDDGPGVPEEEMARIFEPFFRMERSRSRETGGTGIGLYIVQTVAHAHGGEVRLSNRKEGGLRAELLLPR